MVHSKTSNESKSHHFEKEMIDMLSCNVEQPIMTLIIDFVILLTEKLTNGEVLRTFLVRQVT